MPINIRYTPAGAVLGAAQKAGRAQGLLQRQQADHAFVQSILAADAAASSTAARLQDIEARERADERAFQLQRAGLNLRERQLSFEKARTDPLGLQKEQRRVEQNERQRTRETIEEQLNRFVKSGRMTPDDAAAALTLFDVGDEAGFRSLIAPEPPSESAEIARMRESRLQQASNRQRLTQEAQLRKTQLRQANDDLEERFGVTTAADLAGLEGEELQAARDLLSKRNAARTRIEEIAAQLQRMRQGQVPGMAPNEPGSSPDNPVQVRSPSEVRRLPLGAYFRTPDGTIIRKERE